MIDLQTMVDNALAKARAESLAKSDQLTLGEMLLLLEPIAAKQKSVIETYGHPARVVFDFEYAYPNSIHSWRGIYAELALGFAFDGEMSINDFIDMLKGCIGKTFTGYKGGEYTMSKHTPIWVANYGNSGSTAVISILDDEHTVRLMTGHRNT